MIVITYCAVKRPGVATITFSDFEPFAPDGTVGVAVGPSESIGTSIDVFGIEILALV